VAVTGALNGAHDILSWSFSGASGHLGGTVTADVVALPDSADFRVTPLRGLRLASSSGEWGTPQLFTDWVTGTFTLTRPLGCGDEITSFLDAGDTLKIYGQNPLPCAESVLTLSTPVSPNGLVGLHWGSNDAVNAMYLLQQFVRGYRRGCHLDRPHRCSKCRFRPRGWGPRRRPGGSSREAPE